MCDCKLLIVYQKNGSGSCFDTIPARLLFSGESHFSGVGPANKPETPLKLAKSLEFPDLF
jgi:hypothetical protein